MLHPSITARGKTPKGTIRNAQHLTPQSHLDTPVLTQQPDVVAESHTIQVTIGRVEVRATPPSPAARTQQQQKPAPSKMSLEEYLKQRSRGGK
jgi:hypothetical protein